MRGLPGRRVSTWLPVGIAAILCVDPLGAAAQQPTPAQDVTAAAPGDLPAPNTPQPVVPPTPAATTTEVVSAAPSAADYETRIQQLEMIVRQMQAQQAQMAAGRGPANSAPDAGTASSTRSGAGLGQPGAGAATPSRSGGAGAPGQSLPPNPPVSSRFDSPATLVSKPGTVKFGPGFEIRTDDEEFFLQFHNLTQIDYRGYQQGGQTPVRDTFIIPRQWWMFSGRITKPIGYFVSFQNAVDTVSMLDVFVDLNYNPKLQGRIGRFKTPFTYEFLVEPIQGLITPERSLFFNNFGQNRDLGAMAYGRLFDNSFDYAAGVFNGTRNGFVANQDSKFFSGFVNWRPFKNSEGSLLENFNVGGSVYSGNAYSAAIPATLRTAVPTSGNAALGVPFLTFNNNVRETGNQAFWDLHFAYFYQQLALIGEWQSGAQDYSLASTPTQRTRLGVDSFYLQAGYLLTGETRSSLGIVKPLRPFDLRKGQRGPGAWEITGRYNYLDIGNQVYTAGLADQNTSANRVSMTDFGFNWHMTQYLKLYFDWQHAAYNEPVVYAPGKRQLTSDMFLVRFQLYF